MNRHILLSCMIFFYLLPIYYVYFYYSSNHSVSNIICNQQCKHHILFFMGLMGIATLLYEFERNDGYSTLLISILLIGIYGLICIHEENQLHYWFAFLVFIAILFFMLRHCYLTSCNSILFSSLLIEIAVLIYIILNIHKNIFYGEVIYIVNFAFYYVYLHFIQDGVVVPPVSEVMPL